MATRKRVTAKRKAAKPKPTLPSDHRELLVYLHEKFAFGPKMDAHLAALVGPDKTDPLLKPPAFINGGRALRFNSDGRVHFGHVDGHGVALRLHERISGHRMSFYWGCREYDRESGARLHWVAGRSRETNAFRPHATELMNFAARVAKFHKIEW